MIVDLRNNEGGADKVARKFMKLIRSYAGNHKIYVLVNNATISQGEIFALRLKKLKNVKILGQTTKGMISYGSNYGIWEKLPSNKFEVYMTDMKDSNKFLLKYENKGIIPDIELNNESDWIEQALQNIKKDF
ncbi:S41 family peptidase [Emticicia sp. C21]|uniref:S41 family peptidase n=1 Tax=Emticicia sp. C21 TaxID=2302915 RepID=UPI000E354969|nr:S41 family peptidase [Emticicia sp. C21]RFS14676.1 hypothetical protein D0T08_20820 [Emticicia sp. C21]